MARFGLAVHPPSKSRNELETIAWFRFPVTWSYLSGPPIQKVERAVRPASQIPPAAMSLSTTVFPLPFQDATSDTPVFQGNAGPKNSAAQWEMVIPKMVRPPSKSVSARNTPPGLAAPPCEPVNAAQDPAPAAFQAPSFLLYTSEDKFLARFWRQIAVVIIALA